MLIPQTVNLAAYRGGTFDAQVQCTNPDGSAFDFTQWTVSIYFVPTTTPVPTISVSGGNLNFAMTASQTASLPVETLHFVIKLVSSIDGSIEYLAHGQFQLIDP